MLTWKEALTSTLAETPVGRRRRVSIDQAIGQVLAQPIIARNDSPPFDMSRKRIRRYPVTSPGRGGLYDQAADCGDRSCGDSMRSDSDRGSAIRLLTAREPPGVGAVVMKEYCRAEHRSSRPTGQCDRRDIGVRSEFRIGNRCRAGLRITRRGRAPGCVRLCNRLGLRQPVVTIAVRR